jgi:hypothetical protein
MSKNDISCQIAYFVGKLAFSQLKTELQKALFSNYLVLARCCGKTGISALAPLPLCYGKTKTEIFSLHFLFFSTPLFFSFNKEMKNFLF